MRICASLTARRKSFFSWKMGSAWRVAKMLLLPEALPAAIGT
jgi:hypothetical protein